MVHDRLARQQIQAEERLTSELIETQKRLSQQGKTACRLTTAVYVVAAVVGVVGGLAALF